MRWLLSLIRSREIMLAEFNLQNIHDNKPKHKWNIPSPNYLDNPPIDLIKILPAQKIHLNPLNKNHPRHLSTINSQINQAKTFSKSYLK